MGRFRTLKFECQLGTTEGYSFTDGTIFTIWISDDDNKIPLYIDRRSRSAHAPISGCGVEPDEKTPDFHRGTREISDIFAEKNVTVPGDLLAKHIALVRPSSISYSCRWSLSPERNVVRARNLFYGTAICDSPLADRRESRVCPVVPRPPRSARTPFSFSVIQP